MTKAMANKPGLNWIIYLHCNCNATSEHQAPAGVQRFGETIIFTLDAALKLKCPCCGKLRTVNSPMTNHPRPREFALEGERITEEQAIEWVNKTREPKVIIGEDNDGEPD